jgi:hypothetical protein
MTKMPLGTKLTQNVSDAIFEMDFDMKLRQGFLQQIEKTRRQFSETKNEFNTGND